jgi:hypothetical protein
LVRVRLGIPWAFSLRVQKSLHCSIRISFAGIQVSVTMTALYIKFLAHKQS